MKRPDAWESQVDSDEVDVIPLVDDHQRNLFPGWTTYTRAFGDSPEVEVFCAGINTKSTATAALWRQGNLLHFGFEQGPSELNATGRALLYNAIQYIARFREDRPIAYVPSVFVTHKAIPLRVSVLARLRGDYQLDWITPALAEQEALSLEELGRAAYSDRFEANRGRFTIDEELRLFLDPDLVALGVDNDGEQFFDRCKSALTAGGQEARHALSALARYVPEGPRNAGEWSPWIELNEPYMFFSDAGRYRWYLDPLAKKRALPTRELRGVARASRADQRTAEQADERTAGQGDQ